jgi:hypothetical protein
MFGGPGRGRSATTLWVSLWRPSTTLPRVDCRPRLNPDYLQHAASERRNLRSSKLVLLPFITEQVLASGNTTYLEFTRRTSLGFAQGTDRAVEPIARAPSMTRGKISLARGVHCCPIFFISFARPAPLYCEEYVCIYTYIHIPDTVQTVY